MTRSFRSEILKLRRPGLLLGSLGSMVGIFVLGVVIALLRADNGHGALTIARLSQPDGLAAIIQRSVEILGVVAMGTMAVVVAQEYAAGTLRNLLVREPRRVHLLAGKIAADLLFVLVSVLIATAVGAAVALGIGSSKGIDTAAWFGSGLGDTLGSTGDLLLAISGYAIFGAMLAIVLRSPAPAVIVGFAWALPLESLLTAAWSSVGHWLPAQQLVAIVDHGNSTSSYGFALVLGAAFVAAAAVGSAALFQRRDVAA